jgi:hypothetical protein
MQAEEMVNQLLRTSRSSQTSTDNKQVDTKLFSLVLEAWKNNAVQRQSHPTAALRAHKLLQQMILLQEQGILSQPPNLQDYHSVLECWNHQTSSSPSVEYIKELLDWSSEVITKDTYELALSVLARGGLAIEAHQLVKELTILPTLTMHNSVLRAIANEANFPDEALRLLRTMQSSSDLQNPDGTSYNLVIQAFCSENNQNVERALELLAEMKARKLTRTLDSYSHVISALAKLGEASKAEELLTQLVQDYGDQFDADLKPTLAPFQTVLWAYSKSYHPNAASKAQALLTHMQELYASEVLEVQPNLWSYNIVIKCWAHSRSSKAPQRAMLLYNEMSLNKVVPDATSMNTLLNAHANSNRTSPIETEKICWTLYHRFLKDPLKNPQPNIVSFGTVLKAWAKSQNSKKTERAEALFRKLQKLHDAGWEQCKPDVVAYASLIKCWANSKQPGAAQQGEAHLRKMQELAKAGDVDLAPDTVCFNATIQGWAKAGNGKRAEQLLQEMLRNPDKRQKPNILTFTAVLSAWAKTRYSRDPPKRAQAIIQQMQQFHQSGELIGVKPNCISYSIWLDCLAYSKKRSSAEFAEQILREKMEASEDPDCKPNVVSYNSVIKAWSYVKDPRSLSKVMALLQELLTKSETDPSMRPNANTFGSILKTLADSRLVHKAERAEAMVELMQTNGISMNNWSKHQFEKCCTNDKHLGKGKSRHQKQRKVPEIPALEYSS